MGSFHEPSHARLLAAFRRGDAQAFEILVDRHQAALLRHARALLGDRSAAEDAVQDAFLKLAQSPPEIEAGDPEVERAQLAAWLHRVTRNGCLDRHRGEARRKRREAEMSRDERVDGGAHLVEQADTRAAVERGLARLNPDQREVLVLRLLQGQSYREIADMTGRKIGTVGWLVSTGLRALASELEPLLGLAGPRGAAAVAGGGQGMGTAARARSPQERAS